MSKILILADTHWGCRNNNQAFYDYQKKFCEFLFSYIKDNHIKHVIHLGDLVDDRRNLHYLTIKRLREDFLEPMDKLCQEDDVNFHIILGNHDIFYKDTNQINALNEIIQGKYHFYMYENPKEIYIDGEKILMLPWITPENHKRDFEIIQNSSAKYCMAHLELKDFEQTKGRLASHGDDSAIFNKFDKVFSGHYHIRSNLHNIFYVGSCFRFNWGDYSDSRGFGILDGGLISYIENPYNIFVMLDYDEENVPSIEAVKDSYCRVNVVNKTSESKFNDFINKIHEIGVIDLLINETIVRVVNKDTINVVTGSTLDIFKNKIETLNYVFKDEIKDLVDNIYLEAIGIN